MIRKKNKLWYYIQGFSRKYFLKQDAEKTIVRLKQKFKEAELAEIEDRVNYYNKTAPFDKSRLNHKVSELRKPHSPKVYFLDTYEYARFFDDTLPIDWKFGDVTEVPSEPSVVKSRPVNGNNENSVVLNLDKVRHFVTVNDPKAFQEKKDLLIGRGAIFGNQQNRVDFYKKYFHHPLCDLGQTNNEGDFGWQKPKIDIARHLDYKFILSLQGNDVATNLKWIMSSNSIAVMPKPTMETWYMEGRLIGGVHYIEIKDDYSDVEEQLNHYIHHPEECLKILQNAKAYRNQFENKAKEDLCALLVLKKYFDNSH